MAKDDNFVLDDNTCELINKSENLIEAAESNFILLTEASREDTHNSVVTNAFYTSFRALFIQNKVIIDQNTRIMEMLEELKR